MIFISDSNCNLTEEEFIKRTKGISDQYLNEYIISNHKTALNTYIEDEKKLKQEKEKDIEIETENQLKLKKELNNDANAEVNLQEKKEISENLTSNKSNPDNFKELLPEIKIIHSFGYYHTIPTKKIDIIEKIDDDNSNTNSIFFTYNNYDSQDLDFYFNQASDILTKNNITSRENNIKESDNNENTNNDNYNEDEGEEKDDLLDDLMSYVDK